MPEKEVRLIDAPVGLLMYKNKLLMKTDYGSYYDGVYSPDCYIVESGEVFIGGTDNAEYRNNLMVTPIDPESLRPHGKWETDREDIEWGNHLKRRYCTNCGKHPHYDKEKGVFILTPHCPHCGAKMEV